MAKAVVTRSARADLADIRRFSVERFGKAVVGHDLRELSELNVPVGGHPFAGAAEPDLGSGVRSFVHRQHRVFCRMGGSSVVILGVLHHARRIESAMLA